MLKGKALIDQINASPVNDDELLLLWLGQHSFVLKTPQDTLYIDPFLSEFPGRLVPPLLKPEEITNASYILGTHDHIDHIDKYLWPTMASASPNAKFVVPEAIRVTLAKNIGGFSLDRYIGLRDMQTFNEGRLSITAVASAHEDLYRDEKGNDFYLGYIVGFNGVRVYHAGDCCVYDGLAEKLRGFDLDAAILPICGRSPEKFKNGIVGSMNHLEAASLAASAKSRAVIPAHYDMFAGNLGPVDAFMHKMKSEHPGIKAIRCNYSEPVRIKK